MPGTFSVQSSGYCPEQDTEYTISVDFVEYRAMGDANVRYAKRGFKCEYCADNRGCKTYERDGTILECPLHQSARYP